jgi:hypothetical protein
MTDAEVRALVREAIARIGGESRPPAAAPPPQTPSAHASHAQLRVPSGAALGGPCLIEPAVACNQCGYCQCLGH